MPLHKFSVGFRSGLLSLVSHSMVALAICDNMLPPPCFTFGMVVFVTDVTFLTFVPTFFFLLCLRLLLNPSGAFVVSNFKMDSRWTFFEKWVSSCHPLVQARCVHCLLILLCDARFLQNYANLNSSEYIGRIDV